MGGDSGPEPLVEGAILALERTDATIILVGDREIINPLLHEQKADSRRLELVHASQVVDMHEKPTDSLKKSDSSIAVASQLVKDGEAEAVVSAGHTGAAVASAIMKWRLLPGIRRPAIAWTIPAREKPAILLDVGATVNCKPIHLYQFAVMGAAFSEHVIGIENPRVGLLNIGEEAVKGNEVTHEAAQLLRDSNLNFAGNAEGRDLVGSDFDVVACDGFVGNIVLKFAESLAVWLFNEIRGEVRQSLMAMLGAMAMKPSLRRFKKRIDYSEYGGAPLLGPNGTCIICHGSSNAKAIASALREAEETVSHKVNQHILETLEATNNGSGNSKKPRPESATANA
jgi:glycerol-3-phosphate acyltransferase PlsX